MAQRLSLLHITLEIVKAMNKRVITMQKGCDRG